jgi:hypothetical protein
MLLANVAWILASAGKRVLAIDWDLEAPGLHHYFHPFLVDPGLEATDGLIDMVVEYSREAVTPEEESSGQGWLDQAADVGRFVAGITWSFPNNGQLHLLPAGRQNASFPVRVNTFQWNHFYEELNGGGFLELVKKKIRNDYAYDHILIDSRTGASDTSGICTVQMPDRLVVCFTASEQSIRGSATVAESVWSQWARLPASTRDGQIAATHQRRIFPILMRIEASEKEKLDAARVHVREVFEWLPGLKSDKDYWNKAEVGYLPFYAFEEVLAVFGDRFRTESSLLASCEHITSLITDGAVSKFDPPSSADRERVLAAYERRAGAKSIDAVQPQRRVQGGRRWFISFNTRDLALLRHLEEALSRKEPDAEIVFTPQYLRAGGVVPQLSQTLAEADVFVLLVGEYGLGAWQVLEYYEAADRQQAKDPNFQLILLLLEGQAAPGLPFLRHVNWIVTPDPGSDQSIARLVDAARGGGARVGELWRYTAPYCGLAPMEEKDSGYFFGRTRETVEVLSALATSPDCIYVLIGNSGVGKTSVAQAGVLAALKRQAWPEGVDKAPEWPHAFRESRRWGFLTLKPGTEPLKALVESFLDSWRLDPTDPKRATLQNDWVGFLLDGKVTLIDLVDATERRQTEELGFDKPPAFFLYIDQGEELYVRAEERQRRRFSEVLAAAIGDQRLLTLMTLRADFFGQLQADESLFVVHRAVNIPPLRETQLREVVSRPAELLDARFESDELVDTIARRTAEESTKDAGALPLLSYLLDDMWTQMIKRGDGILRLPATGFELGGVLADRANAFLLSHPLSEGLLRRLFTLKLATVREDGEPTRRRAFRSELTDEEWRLVSELADYPNRLLVTVTHQRETYTEVAHEAIFRRWDKVRNWIASEREFLAWRGQLESQRRVWEQVPAGLKNDALLMGLALAQAQRWVRTRPEDLSRADRAFIDDSIRDSTRRRWRQRALLVGAVMIVVALALLLVLAMLQRSGWLNVFPARVAVIEITSNAIEKPVTGGYWG